MYLKIILLTIFMLFLSCDTAPEGPENTFNPLDPANPKTHGDPFKLSAVIADGGIKLNWSIPDVPAVSHFNIYRSENEKSGYTSLIKIKAPDSTYTDETVANGHSYWYRVAAVDKQGKESGVTNTVPVNIKTEPVLVINGGAQYTAARQVNLTILANTATQMILSNTADFSDAVWEDYATSKNWTLTKGDGQKTVYMKVKYDSTESGVVHTSILPQPINPGIAILADTIQYAPSRDVQVTLSATGTNLKMELSEDSTFSGIDWQSFSAITGFKLSAGEGHKTIYAQFKNDFEMKSEIIKDDIIVDFTFPILRVKINPDSGIAKETEFFLDPLESSDNYSSKNELKMRFDYDEDGIENDNWVSLKSQSIIFNKGGRYNSYRFQIKDRAGNVSDTTLALFVNTRPEANYKYTIDDDDLLLVHFDASESYDYEDGTNIQYRWDWDNDGIWDTNWGNENIISHKFEDGEQQPVLEVRDNDMLTSYYQLSFNVSRILFMKYYDSTYAYYGDTYISVIDNNYYLFDSKNVQLIKTDDDGNMLFKKRFWTQNYDLGYSNITDGNYIYLVVKRKAQNKNQYNLLKIDENGNKLFEKAISKNGYSTKIIYDGAQIIAVSSEYTYVVTDSQTYERPLYCIKKINLNGEITDSLSIQVQNPSSISDLVLSNDKSTLYFGTGYGDLGIYKYSFNSIQKIASDISCNSLYIDNENNIIIGGGSVGSNIPIVKLDINGNILFEKNYGFGSVRSIYATKNTYLLACDDESDAYYDNDILLLQLDYEGNKLWEKKIKKLGLQSPGKLTKHNNFYILGGLSHFYGANKVLMLKFK